MDQPGCPDRREQRSKGVEQPDVAVVGIVVHGAIARVRLEPRLRVDDCRCGGPEVGKHADGHARQHRIAAHRGVLALEGDHRQAADVGLDLVPQRAARAAPVGPDLRRRCARRREQLQVAPEHERDRLQHRPHEVCPAVGERQPGEDAARRGLVLWAERAGEVGQHHQAVAARGRGGRERREQVVGVCARAARPMRPRRRRTGPGTRSASCRPSGRPGSTGTVRAPSGRRRASGRSGRRRGARRTPGPSAPRRCSRRRRRAACSRRRPRPRPGPSRRRRRAAGDQAQLLGLRGGGVSDPTTSPGRRDLREPLRRRCRRLEHRPPPAAVPDVEQQARAGDAPVGHEAAREPVQDEVLDEQEPGRVAEQRGLVRSATTGSCTRSRWG